MDLEAAKSSGVWRTGMYDYKVHVFLPSLNFHWKLDLPCQSYHGPSNATKGVSYLAKFAWVRPKPRYKSGCIFSALLS